MSNGARKGAGSKDPGLMQDLRKLQAACGSNKHDQAMVLILACIGGGINTKGSMIATLRHLSFNPGHICRMLEDGTGSYWRKDANGCYIAIPEAAAAA